MPCRVPDRRVLEVQRRPVVRGQAGDPFDFIERQGGLLSEVGERDVHLSLQVPEGLRQHAWPLGRPEQLVARLVLAPALRGDRLHRIEMGMVSHPVEILRSLQQGADRDTPLRLEVDEVPPVGAFRKELAYVFGGHEEGGGEAMRFLLRFSSPGPVRSVHHKVTKLMRRVEPGSGRNTFVVAEDDNGMVLVPHGEAVDV